eukprot:Hpha_TRINITY_DN15280_c1_g1::TRINITY_DN15280_c1_g1_i1::g.67725::m.67725
MVLQNMNTAENMCEKLSLPARTVALLDRLTVQRSELLVVRADRRASRQNVVGLDRVREVEDGARVAAVHKSEQPHSIGKGGDEVLEDVVVGDEPRVRKARVVHRDKGLVLAVLLAPVLVGNLSAVAGVVEEDGVPVPDGVGDPLDPSHEVLPGRSLRLDGQIRPLGLLRGVQEDLHELRVLLETVGVDVLHHTADVVRAPAELGRRAIVVDTGQHRELAPLLVTSDRELLRHGVRDGAAQLGHLLVLLLLEERTHGLEELDPRGAVRSILTRDVEERTGARASCPLRGASGLLLQNGVDVGHVRRGLRVLAPGDHEHLSLHCLRGLLKTLDLPRVLSNGARASLDDLQLLLLHRRRRLLLLLTAAVTHFCLVQVRSEKRGSQ